MTELPRRKEGIGMRLRRPLLIGLFVAVVQVLAIAAVALMEASLHRDWPAGVRLVEIVVLVLVVPGMALWAMPRVVREAPGRSRRPVWIATSGVNLVSLIVALGLEETGVSGWLTLTGFGLTILIVATLVVLAVERSV